MKTLLLYRADDSRLKIAIPISRVTCWGDLPNGGSWIRMEGDDRSVLVRESCDTIALLMEADIHEAADSSYRVEPRA